MVRSRRSFLKGGAAAAAAAGAALAAPAVHSSTAIRWRLQTYAGEGLAEHVIKPTVDAFNRAANGEMTIELLLADQLVPGGELFDALQRGEVDLVQSDDDSMAAPVDVAVFGGYFPLALRYSLDVPVLFSQYGLDRIWDEAYTEVGGVKWLSAGAWDPCHFVTKGPIRSVGDLKGKRVSTFPTAGRFLSRLGVEPLDLGAWDDIETILNRADVDGIAWSGITEAYAVGWADKTSYFLTNNICGAWIGHFLANDKRWAELPDHLKALWRMAMDSSHYDRLHWYWGGEADLRVGGTKLELTTIPDDEWVQVEAEAVKFWDEIAATSPRARQVVETFNRYNTVMAKAGRPYRY